LKVANKNRLGSKHFENGRRKERDAGNFLRKEMKRFTCPIGGVRVGDAKNKSKRKLQQIFPSRKTKEEVKFVKRGEKEVLTCGRDRTKTHSREEAITFKRKYRVRYTLVARIKPKGKRHRQKN